MFKENKWLLFDVLPTQTGEINWIVIRQLWESGRIVQHQRPKARVCYLMFWVLCVQMCMFDYGSIP